jgi:hypothetical protein
MALAALLNLSGTIWLGAQNQSVEFQQNAENAAVKYLRADVSLRQSYALPPDAASKLQKAMECLFHVKQLCARGSNAQSIRIGSVFERTERSN